jgi:hypothetical protein
MPHFSLKFRLAGLILSILLSITGALIFLLYWNNHTSLEMISRFEHDMNVLVDLRMIQTGFSKEVQEWKNTLLRGHETKDYQKYSKEFDAAVKETLLSAEKLKTKLNSADDRKYVDHFISEQKTLKDLYIQSRDTYLAPGNFDYKAADKQVRGKDRAVTEALVKLGENMLSNDELSKELMRLEKDMNAGRVKLDKSVFVERHLPNIVNNGNKPTEELQNELILIAGGETKRIDLMDNGKVVLTLPSSVSSGVVLDNKDNKQLDTIKSLTNIKEEEATATIANENNKAINKAITDTEKLKTDWTYVVEYFANEASKVVKDSDIKVKPKLEVEVEDEFVYD